MGLVYNTSSWADTLWKGHVARSATARQLLQRGRQKQRDILAFSQDVYSALYLRHPPKPTTKEPPAWATDLLTQAAQLPEWQQLKRRCTRDGFAAGLATEAVLEHIVGLIPHEQHQPPPSPSGNMRFYRRHQRVASLETARPGQEQEAVPSGTDADTRQRLRTACREATRTMDTAEASLEGLTEAFGLHAGTEAGQGQTLHDLDQVRQLYALVQDNPTLGGIAELAGRLQRLGSTYKRTHVTPAAGAIQGITIGGDLERVLPAELAGLRSPRRLQRLQTLQHILEKRALQYLMRGMQDETRGPICICIDESGSMHGLPLRWAKAVALALLTTATQQRRAWALCGFNAFLQHQHVLLPDERTVEAITQALSGGASGGTAFDPPLTWALETIRTSAVMHKADIILITDGHARVSPDVAGAVLQARLHDSVQLYCIYIGQQTIPSMLAPLASQGYRLSAQPTQNQEQIAPLIALA